MTDYWCFRAVISGQTLPLETGLEVVLDAEALSVEKINDGNSVLQAWFEQEPDRAVIDEVVSRSVRPEQVIETQLICHQNRDWLAENRKDFPPLQLGPFWIYGSHIQQNRPAGSLPLLVEAALAFGSGTHPTTQTCLLALADQRKASARPRRILDMGCGSAILAMAAQRLFPAADIFAVDNDAVSVRTAIENRRKNQISPAKMRAVVSEGFAARYVSRNGPYDIILANILAGPLRRMAADLTSNLAPRGKLILSGLLRSQARQIIGDYRARQMVLDQRLDQGEWCCLVFTKRRIG
ncbi:ribosomal protein L11 methylase [SAR116 cluster alpha proteobacterium HIMB100]|nr:ribosomal protein L11 methylase [SAR116 cluster alpha proteobacterium HIMB100]